MAYFQIADAFFFSTEMLNESINKTSKPYVVNYGTYRVEEIIKSKFDDGLIHCVYAGTLDPKKGGCAASIAAAEFLPEGYHIHILGFGNDDYIKKTNDLIDEISLKTKCQITYDGLKSGKEYLSFLQSCHIGLSTQNPDASFNATSFPSKVLSYLSNGLHVVTVDVPSISNSKVGAILTYYKKQDPREIANAIRSIDINQKYNPREFLSNLANEFERELSILMRAITGNVK